MQLTLLNFAKKYIPGHIFRGKRRLVKPVSNKSIETLHREYELQEQNMWYLLNPYLTLEESHGHAKALGKKEKLLEQWRKESLIRTMRPHVTLEERLGHLNTKKAWE